MLVILGFVFGGSQIYAYSFSYLQDFMRFSLSILYLVTLKQNLKNVTGYHTYVYTFGTDPYRRTH